MIDLDLTKDPVLLLLLKKIIRGTSRISLHDQKLVQAVDKLKELNSHPQTVDYSILNQTIKTLAEMVKGYETSAHTDSEVESPEEPGGLPVVIYNFMQKIDELKTKTSLENKYFSTAELEVKIDNFYKLSNRK